MDFHSTCQIPHDQPLQSCRRLTLLANLLAKFKSYFERSTFLYQIANTTQILNLTRLAWTPSACLCILLKCKVSLPRFPIYICSYRRRPVRPCRWGWRGWVMADDRYHRAAPRGSACTGWQNFECFGVPNGVSVFGSPPQVLNRPSCSSSCWKRHCPTHLGHPLGYCSHCWRLYLVSYWQQRAWSQYSFEMRAQNLDLLKGWWREVPRNQLLSRFRTGWDKRLPAGGCCAEARYSHVCGLLIIIYHCHSDLVNIAGSCVPILFTRLLHCFPASATESIFLVPPLCKIRFEALFTALWITSK